LEVSFLESATAVSKAGLRDIAEEIGRVLVLVGKDKSLLVEVRVRRFRL
jgi:hypothetical protein